MKAKIKKNTKSLIAGLAAFTMTFTALTASSISAFATEATQDTSTVTTERSAHTYTYFQIFTGTWSEDAEGNIYLTDADYGSDIDKDGLIAYVKTNGADIINEILVKRAVNVKLVPAGSTIADVEAAYKAWKGEAAWETSEYNIDNFGKDANDILAVFSYIQDNNTYSPDLVAPFSGADYVTEEDPFHYVTEGERTVINILRKFIIKSNGTQISADYNEEVSAPVTNGYYMIFEQDKGWDKTGRNSKSDETRTAVLMKIVDREIRISPKLGTPTVEKKIRENVQDVESVGDDLIGAYNQLVDLDKWNDAADYSIGDSVPFAIFGSMPENISDYKTYYYSFHDRLAKGFEVPDVSDIKVVIGKTDPVQKPSDGDNAAASRTLVDTVDITDKATITINKNTDGSTAIDITFDDLLSVDDNLDFNIDMDTVVFVQYDAILGKDAVIGAKGNTNGVYLEYGRGKTDTTTEETHDDGVVCFTYQVDINKLDSDTLDELGGAVFTLQALDGDHAGKYVVIDENGKVSGWTAEAGDDNYMTTPPGGLVSVIGLDDGKYELVEVKAPKGYHSLKAPITITIDTKLDNTGTYIYIEDDGTAAFKSFDKSEDPSEATATTDAETGIYALDVFNDKGIKLPQTGGTGAVALYVCGGALLLGGAVYFATRKKKEDQ